jgi:hypothetical protein
MQRRHTHTIRDGRVTRFAESFTGTGRDAFGRIYEDEAVGPYEVSASRSEVRVHYARIAHPNRLPEFVAALEAAWNEHEHLLACDGRPKDGDNGEPRDCG